MIRIKMMIVVVVRCATVAMIYDDIKQVGKVHTESP